MGSGDTLSVLIWSMFVFLFGIGIFPLAAKIFSRFGSGGFIISQALGIILTSLLVWTLTYLNIGMFNLPFIIGAYAVISLICLIQAIPGRPEHVIHATLGIPYGLCP